MKTQRTFKIAGRVIEDMLKKEGLLAKKASLKRIDDVELAMQPYSQMQFGDDLEEIDIVGVDQQLKKFLVHAMDFEVFKVGDSIEVVDSTGNNGKYTITARNLGKDKKSPAELTVAEEIPNTESDGWIRIALKEEGETEEPEPDRKGKGKTKSKAQQDHDMYQSRVKFRVLVEEPHDSGSWS